MPKVDAVDFIAALVGSQGDGAEVKKRLGFVLTFPRQRDLPGKRIAVPDYIDHAVDHLAKVTAGVVVEMFGIIAERR